MSAQPAPTVPRFDQLPLLAGGEERHAWEVFGPGDELGCLNFIGPDQVRNAAAEVVSGEVVSLNLPLDLPQPQFWTRRTPMTHHHESRRNIRDDRLDGFQLQGSTQWDGFRHQRYRQYGFYGGRQDPDLDEGGEIGIDAWADRGIVTRGVLVDVAAELERRGDPLVPDVRRGIDHVLIEETLASQQTEVRCGDILLVRTGWLEWYLGMDEQERAARAEQLAADLPKAELPGLSAGLETVAWLWDHRIAAIAFDNPTVETLPYRKEDGWAHNRLLPLLGMPLGELWKLDALSAKCAEVARYSFLLTSAPLNLRGGAGSPANAYAVL